MNNREKYYCECLRVTISESGYDVEQMASDIVVAMENERMAFGCPESSINIEIYKLKKEIEKLKCELKNKDAKWHKYFSEKYNTPNIEINETENNIESVTYRR